MGVKLHNISIEGIDPANLDKKRNELHSVVADFKRQDMPDPYKFHGLSIERMTVPDIIIKTFDGEGNILSAASITLSGVSIGDTNELGYLFHRHDSDSPGIVVAASKDGHTSASSKISVTRGVTTFQSIYLAQLSISSYTDKAVFRVSDQKIVKRTVTGGDRSFSKVLRADMSTSGAFSTSNVTEQQLYDHFIALTSGSPVSDKVILVPIAGKYKYIRRFNLLGQKRYQAVLRSSLETTGNFNASSHNEQEIFDFMVEFLTGTNP